MEDMLKTLKETPIKDLISGTLFLVLNFALCYFSILIFG